MRGSRVDDHPLWTGYREIETEGVILQGVIR